MRSLFDSVVFDKKNRCL